MGPFGTALILPMVPELRETFDASTEDVSLGFTAYLFPMALLMLVSGTIGERFGKTRVLRITFLAFAVASLATAAAPTLGWFLAGRVVQGSCNAFFTPLLLAGLADLTPPESLGKQVGLYASFQTAGSALSPLVGGIAGDIEWRLAFLGAAIVSFFLTLVLPQTGPPRPAATTPIRPLLTRRVLGIGIALLFGAAGTFGAYSLLVGLSGRDVLGLSPTGAGLVIFLGNTAGLVAAPAWGRLVDRAGLRSTSIIATIASIVAGAGLALADNTLILVITWILTGALIVGMVVSLQSLAATAVPSNRGGALSLAMSFRFLGHALAPLLWVPVFEQNTSAAFIGAASLGFVTIVALWFTTAPRAPTTN